MPKFTLADALRIEKAWEDYYIVWGLFTGQPAPYPAMKVLRKMAMENKDSEEGG